MLPRYGRECGLKVIAARRKPAQDAAMTSPTPTPVLLSPPPLRRIAALLYPGVQILDVTGPLEVFSTTSRRLQAADRAAGPSYEVELVAATAEPVRASSGLVLLPGRTIDTLAEGIDTLIIPGGRGSRDAAADPRLVDWIRAMAPRVRRLAAVCTGAFLLAETRLLDGRRATTHWASCARLAERPPAVRVEPDALFVRDGMLYSSAGVTAGMDLALALVEEDFGRAQALETARWLVMFLKRPGGQSQFSSQLAAQSTGEGAIGRLQAWILAHPAADLRVPARAAKAAMSPRHFARRFQQEAGLTPAAFVEQVRLEAARRQLSETPAPLALVAATCGFGDVERLRRAFRRRLGVNPHDYRARFHLNPTDPAPGRQSHDAHHRPAAV